MLWTKAGTQTTHSGLGLRLGLSQVWTYGWKGLLACFMLVIPQLGQTKSKGLSVRIMSVKFFWSLNLRTFTKCSVILVSLTYFQELSSIILGLLVFLPHCALLLTLCIRMNSRGRFPVEEQLLTRAYSKGLNIKPVTDPCKHDVQRLSQAASYISRGDGL